MARSVTVRRRARLVVEIRGRAAGTAEGHGASEMRDDREGHRDGERIVVHRDGRVVGALAVAISADRVTATTVGEGRITRSEADDLLDGLVHLAGVVSTTSIVLDSRDPALRTRARDRGFHGSLRTALELDVAGLPHAAPAITDSSVQAALADLLPGTAITVRRRRFGAGLLRRLSDGVRGGARVVAQRDGSRVVMIVPIGPNLMLEPLAAALDTALDVGRRFAPYLGTLRVRFGLHDAKMVDGRIAGYAGDAILMNVLFVDGDRHDRLAFGWSPPSEAARVHHPVVPAAGRFAVDGVMAHEIGHELDRKAHHLSGTSAFRVSLGRVLGVESVEQALHGNEPNAPAAWREARSMLIEQVSGYATTNCAELFAELFEIAMQGPANPVVTEFERILAEEFPTAVR